MKTFSLRCLLALASLLLGLTVPLQAAEKPLQTPASTADVKPAPYDLQIVDGRLLRPNGAVEPSLANVVDALREQYTEANIIMSPGLTRVTVGDLKLRTGKLNEELEAVRVASGDRFDLQTPGNPNPKIDPNTGLPIAGSQSVNAGLFVLREVPLGAQGHRIVEAFNIGPYLESLRQKAKEDGQPTREVDDQGLIQVEQIIADTIKSFREDTPDSDQPAFKYHPGATLLIVIGKVDSVEIARKIVNALPGMNGAPAVAGRETEQEHAAGEAFRARYGLAPRTGPVTQPGAAPPEANPKK